MPLTAEFHVVPGYPGVDPAGWLGVNNQTWLDAPILPLLLVSVQAETGATARQLTPAVGSACCTLDGAGVLRAGTDLLEGC